MAKADRGTIVISSDSDASYQVRRPKKKKASASRKHRSSSAETSGGCSRPHSASYHDIEDLVDVQENLLEWFEGEKLKRGMPWRRPFDASSPAEAQGQHAYEVWVSEVMLQQTQVATVIDYWKRWTEKWPTVADLAKADVEEVNAAWKGLGYYRRARSLLSGAQKVMATPRFKGRLPSSPEELEKEVDGVGRYTAGAICSIAYGIRTPIVDGNIHRVLTRTLAIHAPQAGGPTIKKLWQSAEGLVEALPERTGVGGDWNQALMELGATVCKPVNPACDACPLQTACKGYKEMTFGRTPATDGEACALCVDPPAGSAPSVSVFPMKKAKAAQREEDTAVCVLEWRPADGSEADRRWLLVKRPEKGLLAGLFEPPSIAVESASSAPERSAASAALLQTLLLGELERVTSRAVGEVKHVFSHILMSYHVEHVVITGERVPAVSTPAAVWLSAAEVEQANTGTGVKKVWAAVYGGGGTAKGTKRKAASAPPGPGKRVLKVEMPGMPGSKS